MPTSPTTSSHGGTSPPNQPVAVITDASSIFTIKLIDITKLAGGSCEVPRGSRGDDLKTIRKNKDRATEGLTHTFELNAFQVTGNHSQEDEDEKSTAARTTQDAIISTSYKCEQLNDQIKAFDMMSAVLVPILKENGPTPADR